MKITAFLPRLLKRTGFTLVELLVVMGIIAILAAVSMQVGIMVLNQAKKAKAANTANQIQTAVLNYYTEYSVYPTPSGASATDFKLDDKDSTSQWAAMIECLAGGISPSAGGTITLSTFTNTRSIAFLNLKASDVGNGSPYTKDAPLNPLPYSTQNPYFNMAIDGDYDGILGGTDPVSGSWLPNFAGTGTFSFLSGGGSSTAGCAVWANCSPTGLTTQAGWCVHTY